MASDQEIVERVRELQRIHAEDVINLTPAEKLDQGVDDDTPRRQAIADAASEFGVRPSTVRTAIRRWSTREERAEKKAQEFAEKRQRAFPNYGITLPGEWVDEVAALQRTTLMALWHAKQSARHLQKLEKSEWYPKGALRLARQRCRDFLQVIDMVTPVGLCPYCKQLEGVIDECAPCYGTGVLLKQNLDSVPQQFLATVLPVVLYRGAEMPVSAFTKEPEQEEMF